MSAQNTLRLIARARLDVAAVAGMNTALSLLVDGSIPVELGTGGPALLVGPTTNANAMGFGASHVWDLGASGGAPAGSRLIDLAARVTASTGSVYADTAHPLVWTIEEIVRAPVDNT